VSINSVIFDSYREEAMDNSYTLTKGFNNNYGEVEWTLRYRDKEWSGDEAWAHRVANHYGLSVPGCECDKDYQGRNRNEDTLRQ
jgi:hypothetical protein